MCEVAGVDEAVLVRSLVDAHRGVRRAHEEVSVGIDLDRHAGMGLADGAELVGVRLGIVRRPTDDLAELRLAVTVEDQDRELLAKAAGLQRRHRRSDRAHVLQR